MQSTRDQASGNINVVEACLPAPAPNDVDGIKLIKAKLADARAAVFSARVDIKNSMGLAYGSLSNQKARFELGVTEIVAFVREAHRSWSCKGGLSRYTT